MHQSQAVIDLWQGTLPQVPYRCSHMTITCFLAGAWTTETGRNCPGLFIITANGLTLPLGKPSKVQNLPVSAASPGTKCYQITHAVFMSALTSEHSALEHTITVVNSPLFCQKQYSQGKLTVWECRRNPMWPKIWYTTDRCNRRSYCDKACGNGWGMKKWSVITEIHYNRGRYNQGRLYY
jgi:hypothetical protein